jgi:hypothetical protein
LVIEAEAGTPELIAQYRDSGAPVVFVCGRHGLEWWKQTTGRPALQKPPVPPDKLANFFATHAHDFAPDVIYRAKTWGRFDAQYQRRFVDLGLMPVVESKIGRDLEQLVVHNVQKLKALMGWETLSDRKGQWLLKSVFWLVSAKILHDKEVGRFAKLDLRDAEPLLDAVAAHFDAEPVPVTTRRQRSALTDIAGSIASFGNLQLATTESLAYVYENMLISKATRQSLGTHSTPSYLVDYIVGTLAPWIVEIPPEERNVFEPACGHAAFLVSAMRLLTELLPEDKSTPAQRRSYLRKRIHGCDIDDFALEIARLSLSLTDIPNPDGWHLVPGDMFIGDHLEQQARAATVFLANPPFENFTPEVRDWYARRSVHVHHVNKTAEMLSRVLPELPGGAVVGVVVPQGFLHSKNATNVRRYLLDRFDLLEICLFPDKVFTFSGLESAVLMARKRTLAGPATRAVRYRRVRERQMEAFRQTYRATSDSAIDQSRFRNAKCDLRVADLYELWKYCAPMPQLEEFATIGKGLQYVGHGTRNLMTISNTSFPGAVRGFSRFEPTIGIHELPREVWMSLDAKSISVKRHGAQTGFPQVVFNEVRTSRGPWRLKALIDEEGHAVTGSFNVARSNGTVTIEWLWALLNSPIANALAYCSSNNKHNQAIVFRKMHVPPIDRTRIEQISAAARNYLEYVQPDPDVVLRRPINEHRARGLWLRVECAVLQSYRLPRDLESQLLSFFAGWSRPGLPFYFDRYFPEGFGDHISLAEYIAITIDWPATNRRRGELIHKKVARTITGAERQELANLQSLAESRSRLEAPLPLVEMERLYREFAEVGKS